MTFEFFGGKYNRQRFELDYQTPPFSLKAFDGGNFFPANQVPREFMKESSQIYSLEGIQEYEGPEETGSETLVTVDLDKVVKESVATYRALAEKRPIQGRYSEDTEPA